MNHVSPTMLCLPLLVATALAQAPAPLPELRTPIHTAAPDLGVPYGTWAAGGSYKASFHDGMTFVPYLGSDYPRNQPWSWRTTSARLGNTGLLARAPVHRQAAWRYEYDHGGLVEAYDVRGDGLEQTFVLHSLPAAGDLVITGAVTSALRAIDVEPAHQGLVFHDADGQPIVDYGAAWAIDARGARLPLATGHRAGTITLTVPGEWLAQAALPVVVDPLLARNSVMASQPVIQSVDVGRDDEAVTHTLLFAVTVAASQFDDDVRVILDTDNAAAGAEVYSDITTNWDSDGAACAFVAGANRWVIVLRRYFPSNAIRESQLRGHVHGSGSLTLNTGYVSLLPLAGINDWRPDIGGVKANAAGSQALIVFQRENNTNTAGHWANIDDSAAYGVLFDATTTSGTFGAPFPIWELLDLDVERPTVNQVAEGGTSFSWVCAMQNYDHTILFGDEWSVRCRRIRNNGVLSNVAWFATVPMVGWQQLAPVVEGMAGRYLVTYVQADPAVLPAHTGASRGRQLITERIDWPHNSLSPVNPHPPAVVVSATADILEPTGLAFDFEDRSHWTIGYRTTATTVPSAHAVRVGYQGQVTEGPLTLHSVAGQPNSGVRCTWDPRNDRAVCAYGVNVSPTSRVYSHPLVYATPAPLVTSGASCHPGAVLGWDGNRQIGAEFNALTVTGAGNNDLHLVVIAVATLDLPLQLPGMPPGCSLLVDILGPGYVGTLPLGVGSSGGWPVPLPEHLPPLTGYFQDWLLDPNGVFSMTARLEVPLVR